MIDKTRVGLNGWGDLVMLCEVCQETFAKQIQNKTLEELLKLDESHRCTELVWVP
jgi:hypothetical protein